MEKKLELLSDVASNLLIKKHDLIPNLINKEYPFVPVKKDSRSYNEKIKMKQFIRDGFIDRYTGKKLVNPAFLKTISYYFPKEFPYQAHWKTDECHIAYWELVPTMDHIIPIALGGKDQPDNWATTSMLNNSIKSNWTLQQLNWRLFPACSYDEWDGFTEVFKQLIEKDKDLLTDKYIYKWYKASIQ